MFLNSLYMALCIIYERNDYFIIIKQNLSINLQLSLGDYTKKIYSIEFNELERLQDG